MNALETKRQAAVPTAPMVVSLTSTRSSSLRPLWAVPLVMAALGLVIAMPAQAAWVSYQRDALVEELYDNAYLSIGQGRITLWTLTNHAKPLTSLEAREYQSEKTLTTIDCASRKSGAEQVIRYAGKDAAGEIVGDMSTPLRLSSVRAGSSDEALMVKVCR